MSTGQIECKITLDFGPFLTAVRDIANAFIEVAASIVKAIQGVDRFGRAYAIDAHGAGNEDADGVWLSDMCAGWLHDSCPSPGYCGERCHQ